MRPLLIAAVVFFLIAAFGAFTASSHINEFGFLALGLASFSGDMLLGARSVSLSRPAGRRRLRSYL